MPTVIPVGDTKFCCKGVHTTELEIIFPRISLEPRYMEKYFK